MADIVWTVSEHDHWIVEFNEAIDFLHLQWVPMPNGSEWRVVESISLPYELVHSIARP